MNTQDALQTPTEATPLESSVFAGPSSIVDFLDPSRNPPLPLIELPERVNPLRSAGVRVFAQPLYLLPLLTLKSLPALKMLQDAAASGALEGVHTLVEASSGNTAFSLAIMAGLFGIRRVYSVVPRDIAMGKLELLRLAGVDPLFSNEAPGEPTGIARARELGNRPGFINLAQYENEANPAAHEQWTAAQIWRQTKGNTTVFCAGLGTTGTIVGASRFFRGQASNVAIVGVTCAPGQAIPGVRPVERLEEIQFDWRSAIDHHVEAGTKESFKKSLNLCRAGLLAGPSSGFALAGLLRFLAEQQKAGQLDKHRNAYGEVVAVFVCGDTPIPYVDKYSTHLDPWDFSESSGDFQI